MSNKIKIKRNSPADYDASTLPSGLVYGELGFHNANSKLFIGRVTQDYASTALADAGAVTTHLPLLSDLVDGNGLTATTASGATDNSVTLDLDAALTTVTSILNTALKIGRNNANRIDFGTNNIIKNVVNNEVIYDAVATGITMHTGNDVRFNPVASGTSALTNDRISSTNTTNTAGHGGLRFTSGAQRMLDFTNHPTDPGTIIFNASSENIDFSVFSDSNRQIFVDASADETKIRSLVIESAIDLTAVDPVIVSNIKATGEVRTGMIADVSGNNRIDINGNTKILTDLIIGENSNLSTIAFEANSSSSDKIEKNSSTGDLTIQNGVTGDGAGPSNSIVIENTFDSTSVADGNIVFKTKDGSTQTAMTILSTGNKVKIHGNLEVDGTTTQIDSQTLTVVDKDIVIANGVSSSSNADGAGIIVGSNVASIKYLHTGTKWALNKNTEVTGTFTASQAITASGGFANSTFDCGVF
tara:strand:- start:1409 stop:2824 length:1416 start_codon:yes stop_codon:yes gene_type:complete